MAIDNVCSPALIKAGFARCGMFPVNIDVIDKTQINFSDKSRAAMLAESSKTDFMLPAHKDPYWK